MDESIEALIRVNLHDFLRDKEGFTLVRDESSKYPENCSSLKMRYGDTVLIVSQRDDGVWLYFNAKEPAERGTVINYLQNRNGGKASFSLGHVKRRVYGGASGGGFGGSIVPVVPRPVVHAPRDLSHVAKHWNQERTVWGLPHCLGARGITAETVTAYKSALRMDKHGNVLFAHTNQDGQIVGYEIKGHKFTGFAKGGVRLLCRLGAEVVEPVKIALTESGVDALSLAQLTGRRDALYCSSGGSVSPHTLDQIERLAAKHPAAEILLAFDNDEAGHDFAGQVEHVLKGREGVRRLLPRLKDWNDELRARAGGMSGSPAAPAP